MSRLRSSLYIASVTRLKLNCYFNLTRSLSNGKVNHYEILDVSRSSSQSAIKEAYYKLSKQYHPDRNPGDDNASDKFRKITEAYDVLSNIDAKRDYDNSLALEDAKSSPYSSNYKRSPVFREINQNTGKTIDSDDYTQFFKNRQSKLDRNQQTTNFRLQDQNPVMEDAVNPFNPILDPQSPPINVKKTYKSYSESGWEDPRKGIPDDGWVLKNDVPTPIALVIAVLLLGSIFKFTNRDEVSQYCDVKTVK